MNTKNKIWLWSGITLAIGAIIYFFVKNSKAKQETESTINSLPISNTEKNVVNTVINKSPIITVVKTNTNTMNTNPATWNVGDSIYAINDNTVATRNDNNGSITGKKDGLMGLLTSKQNITGYWVVWIRPEGDQYQYVISAKLVYVKIKQS